MTDQEWAELTLYRKLPAEVRKPIEAELDLYRRFANAMTPPPSETKENLEHAAELASRLLKVIERFGPDEQRALVPRSDSVALSDLEAMCAVPKSVITSTPGLVILLDPAGEHDVAPASLVTNTTRLDALKRLTEHRLRLTALLDEMMRAAASIERGKRDASNVRALVKRVSEILEPHGGPLTKAKPNLRFAEQLGKLADPKIGRGSMKEAIESLEPELAPESPDNPGWHTC